MPNPATLPEATDIFAQYLAARDTGAIEPDVYFSSYPQLRPELDRKLNAYQLLQRVFFAIRQDESCRDALSGASLELEGKTLDDFKMIREIGRGGFGVIYLAQQLSLDRRVAFKVMHPSLVASASARERFIREGRAVAKLRHPNIVSVHAAGETEGYAYLAMDLVTGIVLDNLIDALRESHTLHLRGADFYECLGGMLKKIKGTLAVPVESQRENYFFLVARLLRDVAAAIHHAHKQGIVHRDIKPANIIIDETGAPQLVDFGLHHTESAQDLTLSTELFGSVSYLPPEQIETPKKYRPEAGDVYGLGVTFYELLTLVPAFKADTVAQTIKLVLRNNPTLPRKLKSGIPRDLEAIVLKAMERSPALRYVTAQDLADDLGRFIEGVPVQARRRPWVSRLWKTYRRDRRGLVLVCALISIGGLLGWQKYKLHLFRNRLDGVSNFADGRKRSIAGDYEGAMQRFNSTIQLDPKNGLAYIERALIRMYQSTDLNAARNDLNKALNIQPSSGDAKAVLSILEFREGHKDEADRLHQALMKSFPASEHIGGVYIEHLRERKRIYQAIAGLEISARQNPKDTQSRLWLGWLRNSEKEFARALVPLDEAIAINPRLPELWIQKCQAHEKLGQHQQALQSISTAVHLAPQDGRAHALLATAYQDIGNFEKAIQEYRIAAAILPSYPLLHASLGYALSQTGRHDEAIEAFQKAVSLGDRSASTLSSLAVHLNLIGRHQEAARYFDEASKLDPRNPNWAKWRDEAKGLKDGDKLIENGEVIDGNLYKNTRYGLSFVFPEKWQLFRREGIFVGYHDPSVSEDYKPEVALEFSYDPDDLKKTWEDEVLKIGKIGGRVEVIHRIPTIVHGRNEERIEYRLTLGEYKLRGVRLSIKGTGWICHVTATAQDDLFDSYKSRFEAALKSVEVVNPNAKQVRSVQDKIPLNR